MPQRLIHLLQRIAPLVGLLLFIGALLLIYDLLRDFDVADVFVYLGTLPPWLVAVALLLTALHVLLLSFYEIAALRYADRVLPYRDVVFASFISNSLAYVLGSPLVTGGAVRYRLYTSWGLGSGEVSKVILFSSITSWVGYLTLGSVVFLVQSYTLPPTLALPIPLWMLGILFLAIIGSYLLVSTFRRSPVRIGPWNLMFPTQGVSFAQVGLASVDLMVAAGVLYVLLPSDPSLTYLHLLSAYLLGAVAGSMAQVPGGLGVFDGIVLFLLSPLFPAPAILGALLAFRAIYFVLPMLVSIALISTYEAARHRNLIQRIAQTMAPVISHMVPIALSITTFLAGAVLVASAIFPAHGARMEWLGAAVPLPIMELSHLVGMLSGVILLFLARAIWLRLDLAYTLTIVTLLFGIAACLLKAVHYEEALILTLLLLTFLPHHGHFTRRAKFLDHPVSAHHLAAIAAVLASVAWMGLFLYQQDAFQVDLLWSISLDANAARALRGVVVAAILALSIAVMQALRPVREPQETSR